jgi:hypothetical protein
MEQLQRRSLSGNHPHNGIVSSRDLAVETEILTREMESQM